MGITAYNKRKTVTSRSIQTAVRLTLPGELAKHSVSEGTKAVTKYTSWTPPSRWRAGSGSNKKKTSNAARSGHQFPPPRAKSLIKKHMPKDFHLGEGASVYLAAVLEYLTAEILEPSANAARDDRKSRITSRHIQFAMRNDEELNKMIENMHIAGGGVLPNIYAVLLTKKRRK